MSVILEAPIFDTYSAGEFYRRVLPNFTMKNPNSILCKDFASLHKLDAPMSNIVVVPDIKKGLVYLLGGIKVGAAGTQSTFIAYDPSSDSYINKIDFPHPISDVNCIAEVNSLDGKLYVAYLDSDSIKFYLYDVESDSWILRQTADMISAPKLTFGGFNSIGVFRVFYPYNSGHAYVDFTPTSFANHTETVFSFVDAPYVRVGYIVYFIGCEDASIHSFNLDTFFSTTVYNNATPLAPKTAFCSKASLLLLDNKIFIIGGYIDSTPSQDIYIYDISLNTVVKADFLFPVAKYGVGYASLESSAYMFGGFSLYDGDAVDSVYSADMLKTVIYYTLDGSDPLDANSQPTPEARLYTGPFTLTLPVNINAMVTAII